MKKALPIIVVLLFFVLNFRLYAWNEPDNFRGIPWNGSESELKKNFPDAFCMDMDGLCDRGCRSEFKIGAISADAYFFFRNNKFIRVSLLFSPDDFLNMEGYFIEKYGNPTQKDEKEFETRGGLKYTNSIRKWKGKKIIINLEKYHSKITESSADIQTTDSSNEDFRILEKERRKGAADL